MALKFLNKKKMHTGTFENREIVWKKEEEHKENLRKQAEREKRLKDERQLEEIKKAKVDAGLLPQSELEKLDFIYKDVLCKSDERESGINNNSTKNDRNDKNKKNIKNIRSSCIDDQILNENEKFRRIHEDPLYIMKNREIKLKEEIEKDDNYLDSLMKEVENELLKEEISLNNNNLKNEKSEYKSKKDSNYHNYEYKNGSKNKHNDINNYQLSNSKYNAGSYHKNDSYNKNKNNQTNANISREYNNHNSKGYFSKNEYNDMLNKNNERSDFSRRENYNFNKEDKYGLNLNNKYSNKHRTNDENDFSFVHQAKDKMRDIENELLSYYKYKN